MPVFFSPTLFDPLRFCVLEVQQRCCEAAMRVVCATRWHSARLANGFFIFRIILVLLPLLQLLLALPIELLRSTTSSGVGAGGKKERDPLPPHDE
ncbi:unnamed protein product [Sphagnum jensenii]|uniref:Uncharacterized protein n=1 Tax=Sphagnum jensenii TaxID=128206 RepID=A0ABP1AB14_9BRYO